MKTERKAFLHKNRWRILFSLSGFVLFVYMLTNVLNNGPILKADKWVSLHMSELQTPVWTKLIIFVTDLNGLFASTIVFAAVSTFLWYRKWYSELRFFLCSFTGAVLLFNVFKFSVQRARPDTRLLDLMTYSFPSGHATMATVLAFSLYVVFVNRVDTGLPRIFLLFACILWPVTIAFTRVYLNVHWLSDVLGGAGLGIFWTTLVWILCSRGQQKQHNKNKLYQ